MSDTRSDDEQVERHAAGTPYGIFLAVRSLASLFTSGRKSDQQASTVTDQDAVASELAALRTEVAELSRLLRSERGS